MFTAISFQILFIFCIHQNIREILQLVENKQKVRPSKDLLIQFFELIKATPISFLEIKINATQKNNGSFTLSSFIVQLIVFNKCIVQLFFLIIKHPNGSFSLNFCICHKEY